MKCVNRFLARAGRLYTRVALVWFLVSARGRWWAALPAGLEERLGRNPGVDLGSGGAPGHVRVLGAREVLLRGRHPGVVRPVGVLVR